MAYCQIEVNITTNYLNRKIHVYCEGVTDLTEAYEMLCAHVAKRIDGTDSPLNQFDYWHNYGVTCDHIGWSDFKKCDAKRACVNWTCLTPGRVPIRPEYSNGHISLHAFDRPPEGIYY